MAENDIKLPVICDCELAKMDYDQVIRHLQFEHPWAWKAIVDKVKIDIWAEIYKNKGD